MDRHGFLPFADLARMWILFSGERSAPYGMRREVYVAFRLIVLFLTSLFFQRSCLRRLNFKQRTTKSFLCLIFHDERSSRCSVRTFLQSRTRCSQCSWNRLVIIAAGAAVLCGYATTRFFTTSTPEENLESVGGEFTQAQYQRELRLRNQEKIAEMTGHGRNTLVWLSGRV